MVKGQVKWFDPKKGYGFIVGPEGQDVFVHYSHIKTQGFRTLRDQEWVEYELEEGDKGFQARQVSPLTATEPPSDAPAPAAGQDADPPASGYEAADDSGAPPAPPASSGYE